MKLLLVDLDHTLFRSHWRDDLMHKAKREQTLAAWDEYHYASVRDEPVEEMVDLVRSLMVCDWYAVGFTARPERYREVTEAKLTQVGLILDDLVMRDAHGPQPSMDTKVAMFRKHFPDIETFKHIIIIDDHPDVCVAMRAEGITVLQAFIKGAANAEQDGHAVRTASTEGTAGQPARSGA